MSGRNAALRAELERFGDTLEAAGFRVYRPGGRWTFLGFAREVDGEWCSATVQASDFGNSEGWVWHMRIVPSRTDGSSMFIEGVPNGSPLTIETAKKVTLPSAHNSVLTKRRKNGGWPPYWDKR